MTRRLNKKILISIRQQKVVSLERELRRLSVAQGNLGCLMLDKPIRDGWYRTYRLRSDIQRTKKVKTYQEVLESTTLKVWGREKKYADKNWKSRFHKLYHDYHRPGMRYLTEKEFAKLSVGAKKHFHFTNRKLYSTYEKVYFNTLPIHYFATTYERAYIVSRNLIAPEIERRMQEINEILNNPMYYEHSTYRLGRYWHVLNPNKRNRRKVKMALGTFDIDRIEQLGNRNIRDF